MTSIHHRCHYLNSQGPKRWWRMISDDDDKNGSVTTKMWVCGYIFIQRMKMRCDEFNSQSLSEGLSSRSLPLLEKSLYMIQSHRLSRHTVKFFSLLKKQIDRKLIYKQNWRKTKTLILRIELNSGDTTPIWGISTTYVHNRLNNRMRRNW